jgi:hypothetical protein
MAEQQDDQLQPPSTNRLASTIRRKQQQVGAYLKDLGTSGLESRLQSATEVPRTPEYPLAQRMSELTATGRPTLVFELARSSDVASSAQLAHLAVQLVEGGADALVVRCEL